MPLQRLHRILGASYSVQIDSTSATVQFIQAQISKRAAISQSKGKTPPPSKAPVVVAALAGVTSLDVRPVDLLRKIGDLTTPVNVNMANLSASWATRRYFWAIAEQRGRQRGFKLSDDARAMDFHQKTLLSDEFGIGFGGLVLESLFQASEAIDVSAALQEPGQYQNVAQFGSAQPDYLMWSALPNTPYYVVECKGCQTRRDATINQIRRGLEQVPMLVFGVGNRQVKTLVVATLMQVSGTTVYVIDPPEPPDEEETDRRDRRDPPYERLGENTWRINNPEEFANIAWSAKRIKLLNWAGQFASASEVARRRRPTESTNDLPNLELTSRTIGGIAYRGRRIPLFPELGQNHLQVFVGVAEEILELSRSEVNAATREHAAREIRPRVLEGRAEPNTSIGFDGSCFAIDGV